jgi:integrase
MAQWCEKADIEPGYTMHGLRKALGIKLAEADASTRQIMESLGHSNIAFAELYSREASKIRLVVQAMDKVTKVEETRGRPALTIIK